MYAGLPGWTSERFRMVLADMNLVLRVIERPTGRS